MTRLEMRLNIYILTQTPTKRERGFSSSPLLPCSGTHPDAARDRVSAACTCLYPPHPASRLGVTGFCLAVQPLGRANAKPS